MSPGYLSLKATTQTAGKTSSTSPREGTGCCEPMTILSLGNLLLLWDGTVSALIGVVFLSSLEIEESPKAQCGGPEYRN